MSEIAEAAQYLRITIEGMQVAVKIAEDAVAGSAKALKNLVKLFLFLNQYKKYGKEIGGTNISNLLKRDSNVLVAEIPKDNIKEFSNMAKKMGILYTKIPNLERDSDNIRVLFHASNYPRTQQIMNIINKKNKQNGVDKELKAVSIDEYANCENLDEILSNEVKMSKREPSTKNSEDKSEKQEDEVKDKEEKIDEHMLVSIDSLNDVKEENDKAIRVSVPGTENKSIWVSKRDVEPPDNEEKSNVISFKLAKKKKYKLYDDNNNRLQDSIVAEELYSNYFTGNEKQDVNDVVENSKEIDKNSLEYLFAKANAYEKYSNNPDCDELSIDLSQITEDDVENNRYLISIDGRTSLYVDKSNCFENGDSKMSIFIDKTKKQDVVKYVDSAVHKFQYDGVHIKGMFDKANKERIADYGEKLAEIEKNTKEVIDNGLHIVSDEIVFSEEELMKLKK